VRVFIPLEIIIGRFYEIVKFRYFFKTIRKGFNPQSVRDLSGFLIKETVKVLPDSRQSPAA